MQSSELESGLPDEAERESIVACYLLPLRRSQLCKVRSSLLPLCHVRKCSCLLSPPDFLSESLQDSLLLYILQPRILLLLVRSAQDCRGHIRTQKIISAHLNPPMVLLHYKSQIILHSQINRIFQSYHL